MLNDYQDLQALEPCSQNIIPNQLVSIRHIINEIILSR